jgi:hypothetical protein
MIVEEVVETLKNKKCVRHRSIEKKKPRKRKYKKKVDFLSRAKPAEWTSLHKYYKRLEDAKGKHVPDVFDNYATGIKKYRGRMSHEKFIDAYLRAVRKRTDIVPNIYCSKAWLLAHKDTVIPARSDNWYMSFCRTTNTHFFLPSYKYVESDILLKTDNCLVTVPQALSKDEGVRFDVQYMFLREVSIYMIPKALKVRNTMCKVPYKVYPLLYTDHSCDDKLKEFVNRYTNVHKLGVRVMTDDYDGFINMLYNNYGQHRFVIERTDSNRICAVLIWEDVNDIIHMLYTVGCMEPGEDYGYTADQWKEYRAEKALRYPETILRYEFMKRFPRGTLFNGGGCSSYYSMRWMQEITQPYRIYELRTYADVRCPVIHNEIRKPVGKLPGEYYMTGKRSIKFKVDEVNRVLFQNIVTRNNRTNEPDSAYNKYKRRRAARILKIKELQKKLKKD